MVKTCPECGIPKDVSLFNKKLGRFSSYCKECTAKKRKNWKKPTREQNKAARLRWRDRNPSGYYTSRREWTNSYRKIHRDRYKEYDLRKDLKRKYGLSIDDLERMKEQQGHLCKVCGLPFESSSKLCIDHDHVTGKVRGLLCNKCNVMLGMAEDNIETLSSAIKYLLAAEAA